MFNVLSKNKYSMQGGLKRGSSVVKMGGKSNLWGLSGNYVNSGGEPFFSFPEGWPCLSGRLGGRTPLTPYRPHILFYANFQI